MGLPALRLFLDSLTDRRVKDQFFPHVVSCKEWVHKNVSDVTVPGKKNSKRAKRTTRVKQEGRNQKGLETKLSEQMLFCLPYGQ